MNDNHEITDEEILHLYQQYLDMLEYSAQMEELQLQQQMEAMSYEMQSM
jgi:hypothetical protein